MSFLRVAGFVSLVAVAVGCATPNEMADVAAADQVASAEQAAETAPVLSADGKALHYVKATAQGLRLVRHSVGSSSWSDCGPAAPDASATILRYGGRGDYLFWHGYTDHGHFLGRMKVGGRAVVTEEELAEDDTVDDEYQPLAVTEDGLLALAMTGSEANTVLVVNLDANVELARKRFDAGESGAAIQTREGSDGKSILIYDYDRNEVRALSRGQNGALDGLEHPAKLPLPNRATFDLAGFDGQSIIQLADAQIVSFDIATGQKHVLGTGDIGPSFAGDRVLFNQKNAKTNRYELHSVKRDGSAGVVLGEAEGHLSVWMSEDPKRVFVVRQNEGPKGSVGTLPITLEAVPVDGSSKVEFTFSTPRPADTLFVDTEVNGTLLLRASYGDEMSVVRLDARTGRVLEDATTKSDSISSIALSNDGASIYQSRMCFHGERVGQELVELRAEGERAITKCRYSDDDSDAFLLTVPGSRDLVAGTERGFVVVTP